MANDIIDINVYETNDSVAITVQPNLTTVNITQINAGNGNVPVGGTVGQVLAKIDSANFNTQWVNQSGGGGGISDAPNDANAYVRSALSWVIGYTKSAIDTLLGNKVDKVTGKELSTEDYTSAEKTKLAGIATAATANDNDANLKNRANHTGTQLASTISDFNNSVQTIADAKVSNVPYDFNTWNGVTNIAPSKDAVRDKLDQMDVNIANKQPQATYDNSQPTIALLDENGFLLSADTTVFANLTELGYLKGVTSSIQSQINSKQPSSVILTNTTASFTTADETKLDGIASGAEVNVNADWNATSGDAQILNKPTIPTAVTATNQLTNNGADGVNPFITALDIPTAGTASTIVREVKNMTGATLTKGTVVYISGANGNKPLVSKALATTDALSSRTFGLLQSDILNNGLGNCVIIGDLSGLDTSSFTEGAQLYLSGVTAGTYTATKILAPTHLVYVGKVTRSHPTLGQIEVGIMNGFELEEIHDVKIETPANNELLVYTSETDIWENKTASEAGLQPTLVSSSNIKTINGSTILGSGDLVTIPFLNAYSMLANNTNSSATAIQQVYRDEAEQNYTGTITWSTTAPTTILNNTYRWQRVGSVVTVQFNFNYNTAASNNQVTFSLPTDMPTPENVTGFTSASEIIAYGTGMMFSSTTAFPTTARVSFLRRNSANTGYEFIIAQTTASSIKTVHLTLTYFA